MLLQDLKLYVEGAVNCQVAVSYPSVPYQLIP